MKCVHDYAEVVFIYFTDMVILKINMVLRCENSGLKNCETAAGFYLNRVKSEGCETGVTETGKCYAQALHKLRPGINSSLTVAAINMRWRKSVAERSGMAIRLWRITSENETLF
jgi:hypothetical protein